MSRKLSGPFLDPANRLRSARKSYSLVITSSMFITVLATATQVALS
ncbi:MAG: hypothetical protein QGF00_11165 [Planctomycetota bacterium]|nr:hypothetical protein [Planctomycetota bacterium]